MGEGSTCYLPPLNKERLPSVYNAESFCGSCQDIEAEPES